MIDAIALQRQQIEDIERELLTATENVEDQRADLARAKDYLQEMLTAELKKMISEAEGPTFRGPFKRFWLTMGGGYHPREGKQHPVYPDRIDGARAIYVVAKNYLAARAVVWTIFGTDWAGLYNEDEHVPPEAKHYLGALATIDAYGQIYWWKDHA